MFSEDNISSFLESLEEAIELNPNTLTKETKISSINWDSLAVISCIALADEYFEVMLSGEDLANVNKIEDILIMISNKK
tara:strand:- start:385 stop:621 length:237 start_codon:yes stop_codon:yes gene_type:complete